MIRSVETRDFDRIADIYNHYVRTTVVTFEEEAVTGLDMSVRAQEVLASGLPWLVLEEEGRVLGYAYASKWRVRSAYRYSVESTIYLDPTVTGRGLGKQLYGALFAVLRATSVHAVIGGIALPNAASVKLHEEFGMVKVAHFKEVGFKFNQWIDVGYWETVLPSG